MDTEALLVAAYSAGYFDGEGTVAIDRNMSKAASWRFRLRISSTDIEVIKKLQAYWGGSLCRVSNRKEHYKEQLAWNIGGDEGLAFAKAILPFCSAKDDQLHIYIHAVEEYNAMKIPGKQRDPEHQHLRNTRIQRYKDAIQAIRSASAFNCCGTR